MSATSGATRTRWSVIRAPTARASLLAAVLLTVLLMAVAHAEERPYGPELRVVDSHPVELSRGTGGVESGAPSPAYVSPSTYVYPSDGAVLEARVRERALRSDARDREPLLFP